MNPSANTYLHRRACKSVTTITGERERVRGGGRRLRIRAREIQSGLNRVIHYMRRQKEQKRRIGSRVERSGAEPSSRTESRHSAFVLTQFSSPGSLLIPPVPARRCERNLILNKFNGSEPCTLLPVCNGSIIGNVERPR